jgi:hypothetical protein
MRRVAAFVSVLACAAATPSVAAAAGAGATTGSLTGQITYLSGSTITIQTGGRLLGVINAMTVAANALSARSYPYVYGGGHAQAGIASIGIRGPGYNGRRRGFDCSGSVAAVLAGGGLWAAGSGVPNDAGVIKQLLAERMIARGPGVAPSEVTLYDDPGVHIFMNIDGRFFGTSDGGGGDPKGGPAWLYDGAPDASSRVYKRYHILPSVLKTKTTYGQVYTVASDPTLTYGAETGDRVQISYAESAAGTMTATAIQYAGAVTVTGTVTSIAPDGSSFALQTTAGQPLTLATTLVPNLVSGLQVGDGIQVTYSADAAGSLVPHALQVTTPVSPPPLTPPPPAPGSTAGPSGEYGYGSGQ